MGARKGSKPWNFGLTESDPRVAKYLEAHIKTCEHGISPKKDCIECRKLQHKKSYGTNIEWYHNYNKVYLPKRNLQQKEIVLKFYSEGNMSCKRCGYSDIRALSIDHINGGGTKHRRSIKGGHIYSWLIKNNLPDDYQVLCMNCNYLKRHEQKEYGSKKLAIA